MWLLTKRTVEGGFQSTWSTIDWPCCRRATRGSRLCADRSTVTCQPWCDRHHFLDCARHCWYERSSRPVYRGFDRDSSTGGSQRRGRNRTRRRPRAGVAGRPSGGWVVAVQGRRTLSKARWQMWLLAKRTVKGGFQSTWSTIDRARCSRLARGSRLGADQSTVTCQPWCDRHHFLNCARHCWYERSSRPVYRGFDRYSSTVGCRR